MVGVTKVAPTTMIKLYRGVNFTNDDTILFNSVDEQLNFFAKHRYEDFTRVQPVDLAKGEFILNRNSMTLFECDYVSIVNQNYSDKIYYCRITSVEWENINACKIKFELDYFQTYLFDFKIKNGFIERECVKDDSIGVHTLDEGLEIGELLTTTRITPTKFEDKYVMLIASQMPNATFEAGELDGMYTGVGYRVFRLYDKQQMTNLNDLLKEFTDKGKTDAIISLLLVPKILTTSNGIDSVKISRPSSLDGYVPVNKKLLTYPYCFCLVSTNDGNSGIFRYELSKDKTTINFTIRSALSPTPECIMWAQNYRGVDNDFLGKLTLQGFPQCPYNIDGFKAWLAMNGGMVNQGILSNAITTGLSVGGSLMTANPVGVVGSLTNGILNTFSTVAQVNQKSLIPQQAHGTQGGNINFQLIENLGTFTFYPQTIRKEYAQSIDNYFTMFGYKVNRMGVPDLKTRTNFNYIKMTNIVLSGNIPTQAKENIQNLFLNGVRLWHTATNFLNYDIENEVL